MSTGTLTIYNASAGSGKTFTLTGIYLSYLFKGRTNYRKILAVTFTNKATAEMKARILDNLHSLSSGGKSDYAGMLMKETGRSEEWIRREAGEILNSILHDFSRFSVSTIDSFFQKIIRAFAREAGLHSGYSIELDHELFLSAAIDDLIASAPSDKQLKNWLRTYALSNIDEGKSWDLRSGITKLASELFREKFRVLARDEMQHLSDKEFLGDYIRKIRSIPSVFEENMTKYGKDALALFEKYKLTDDMFYQKGRGIPKFVRKLAEGEVVEPGCFVKEILSPLPRWSSGPPCSPLRDAISAGLEEILKGAISYYEDNVRLCSTARVVSSNIYALGILSDILINIRRLTSSENAFLLSDAGEFLSLITEKEKDQAPFIFEKVGTRYENFMIDEFQDTSLMQWKNFKPLIDNSMAEGADNLVVGDIKQSIYRWRNSDWTILGSLIRNADGDRTNSIPLLRNWRSCKGIIRFNNSLFTLIPGILDEKFSGSGYRIRFSELYNEAVQKSAGNENEGYVKIEFLQNGDEKIFQESVLERIPGIIETLQDKGYRASDIGILVRENKEGGRVLSCLMDYARNNPEKAGRYNYNVVSNESLLLANSASVNFIVSVLSAINDPSNLVATAAMIRSYLLASGRNDADDVMLNAVSCKKIFPSGYEELFSELKQLPLFESVERIILFFGLGEKPGSVAYLNAFQDLVLGFTRNGNPGIAAFLEWWENTGQKKSLVLPATRDAIRILTIHKSKGLEFDAVIVPFISWEMDHKPFMRQLLWVKPSEPPFSELGIVPVRYSKELEKTIFEEEYLDERFSVHLDNLNLLYVAFTRARNALFGFSVADGTAGQVSSVLRQALESDRPVSEEFTPARYFSRETNTFEMGSVDKVNPMKETTTLMHASGYNVSFTSASLRLKLHGENYFSAQGEEIRKKINYGKLMHEIFEGIDTAEDIDIAVRKLVLEGKLPEKESGEIKARVRELISGPGVSEWFAAGNIVMKEASIILTSGNIRRPDRVITRNSRTSVIDFKFGEEKEHYADQLCLYKSLLEEMGYANTEAFIWYVDKNKIVKV